MAQAQQAQLSPSQLRTLFLGTAVRRSQILPAQAFNPNGPMTFIMPNAGVGKLVRVMISGTISATTAAASTGARWPYSLFSLATFTDPLGINRVQAKPYFLNRLSYLKRYGFYKPFNTLAGQLENPTAEQGAAALITNPLANVNNSIPTTGIAIAGFFDIPISISPVDPRGAFRLDVANGQTTLTLNPAAVVQSTVANVDTPLTLSAAANTVNVTAINIQPIYYYWDPVAVAVGKSQLIPYPEMDMMLVHELLTTQDAAGLVPGVEKQTTLPTGREYYRIIQNLSNVNVIGAGQGLITRRRFLVDGNIPGIDETWAAYVADYFDLYGTLPPDEEVVYNFMDRPWDSNRYGQIQTSLFLSAAGTFNAGAVLETLRETLYATQQIPA